MMKIEWTGKWTVAKQDYAVAMDYLAGHMKLNVDANGKAIHGYMFLK